MLPQLKWEEMLLPGCLLQMLLSVQLTVGGICMCFCWLKEFPPRSMAVFHHARQVTQREEGLVEVGVKRLAMNFISNPRQLAWRAFTANLHEALTDSAEGCSCGWEMAQAGNIWTRFNPWLCPLCPWAGDWAAVTCFGEFSAIFVARVSARRPGRQEIACLSFLCRSPGQLGATEGVCVCVHLCVPHYVS